MTEHLHAYLAYLHERGVADRTQEQYRHKIQQWLTWMGSKACTLAVLNDYKRNCQTRGLRPRTIRVAFTAVRSFIDYLRAEEIMPELPDPHLVRLPRIDSVQRVRPTQQDMELLFAAIDHLPRRTLAQRYTRGRASGILTCLAYAGLRRSELLALDTTDLVEIEPGQWALRVRCGKGSETRFVPLVDHALAALRDYLAVRAEWCTAHAHTSAALWPVDGGESQRRLAHRGLTALWLELLDVAGIKKELRPHGLRHFFASTVEQLGGLAVAQKAMGHSRPDTTYQYLHADDTRVATTLQGLPQFGAAPPRPGAVSIAGGAAGTSAAPMPDSTKDTEPQAKAEHAQYSRASDRPRRRRTPRPGR